MFSSHKYMTVGSLLKYSLLSSSHSLHTNFKSSSIQTFHLLLSKCSSMAELKVLHAQIILHGLTNENLTIGKLISFCAVSDSGDLQYGQFVFDQILQPNKFMYNSLIRGYANSDDPVKAISLYRKMIGSGVSPNEFTLPFVLKACASKSAYWVGVCVHGQAIKLGIGDQVCVQNVLMNVYVVCGLVRCARQVFDDMLDRTLVTWNSMIGGYSRVNCLKEAFLLFREMRELGVEPDEFTFVNLLSVCSQTCDLNWGRCVHWYLEVTGAKTDNYVQNALVDMYAKCGQLLSAQTVFDRMLDRNVVSWTSMATAYANQGLVDFAQQIFDHMPMKNVVSWNSMISCFVQKGRCREALDLFKRMCDTRVVPDEATLVSILSACSQLGNLILGKKTHNYICDNNIRPTITLSNSLMDMYAKCGPVDTALEIFFKMLEKNVVSWNVIIGGLALHGRGLEAIKLFEKMTVDAIQPDEITFTGLLSACSHSGLVDSGRYYFYRMSQFNKVSCEIEHYACMVDLLGRGGFLEEAVKLIRGMPMKPDIVVWGALLGACRTHGNVEIGKQIFKQVLELEPYDSGLFVLISNIFCEAQRWEDVKKIWKLIKGNGIKKCRAISAIEIDGCVYEFLVDDKKHDRSSDVYSMLDQLTDHLKSLGYLCNVLKAHVDVEEI